MYPDGEFLSIRKHNMPVVYDMRLQSIGYTPPDKGLRANVLLWKSVSLRNAGGNLSMPQRGILSHYCTVPAAAGGRVIVVALVFNLLSRQRK